METPIHVVAIPYPGRGHINPMVNLCRSLGSAGFLITFVVTEEWLQILLSATPDLPLNLRLRSVADVLPSERTRGGDMFAFIRAVFTLMGGPVEELLARLEPAVDAIVADALLPWVVGIGEKMRAPVTMLFTQSATMFLAFHLLGRTPAAGDSDLNHVASGEESEFLNYIPTASSIPFSDPSYSTIQALQTKFKDTISWSAKAHCILFTSFYELESDAIDSLKTMLQKPIYCLGNSIPHMTLRNTTTTTTNDDATTKWLDAQPRSSVLYVSFGSFLSLSAEQMEEIACGLLDSGARFLWVVRMEETCFTRIEEMMLNQGQGKVVPWCDQLNALCHHSVGGFLTHCGWNSTMEAMYAGVPMLTFPLFWDQEPNSKFVVDVWKVGLSLRLGGDEGGEEEEEEKKKKKKKVVGRDEVGEVVKRLMDLDDGETMKVRGRVAEFRDKCRREFGDGGSVARGFSDFVRHVLQKAEI